MTEKESGKVLLDSIEIHTVELGRHKGTRESLGAASVLEQWCYWIMNSHEHSEEELRELLPGLEFLHATRELRRIQEITEEKQMYDSREKGYLDWQSSILDAREEGLEMGLEKGFEKGREEGVMLGRLLALQEILGETLATEEEIKQWPISRLSEAIVALQAKLRDRKN